MLLDAGLIGMLQYLTKSTMQYAQSFMRTKERLENNFNKLLQLARNWQLFFKAPMHICLGPALIVLTPIEYEHANLNPDTAKFTSSYSTSGDKGKLKHAPTPKPQMFAHPRNSKSSTTPEKKVSFAIDKTKPSCNAKSLTTPEKKVSFAIDKTTSSNSYKSPTTS